MYGKTVPFMGKLIQYSSLFCVVPWYSVQNFELVHKKLFKWYSIILAVSMICTSLPLLYLRRHLFPSDMILFTLLPVMIELTALSKFLIAILGAAFWHMRTWEQFLTQIFSMKRSVGKNSFEKYQKIIFITGNVLIFALYSAEFVLYLDRISVFIYFSTSYIFLYFGFILVNLVVTFTTSLRSGYQHINKLFKSLNFANNYDNSMRTLRRIKKIFLTLDETVDNFNKLFGSCILLTLFEEVLNMLGYLLNIVQTSLDKVTYEAEDENIVVSIFYVTASTVSRNFNTNNFFS